MEKIALIIPNNIWVSPYLTIYTRIFDTMGVGYDVISWDREGRKEDGIQFHYNVKSRNIISILWAYLKYAKFLKCIIQNNGYDKLVIFTPQVGIFLSSFLEKNYKGKYVFDYRDLSIEQKSVFTKKFRNVLSNSFANVISSPGFKRYLPFGFEYLISHNFNTNIVKKAVLGNGVIYDKKDISILTIGALRTDMNIEVMDALGNVPGFRLSFVGKGIAAHMLEDYAKGKGYNNILFTGYYKKEDESSIYNQHSFVNIVYPLIPSHISALSNRFYNSLIYKRPMIVTRNTMQGDYAVKYGVGLVIDNCNKLAESVIEYYNKLDFVVYSKQCNLLLNIFLNENDEFEEKIKLFVKLKV